MVSSEVIKAYVDGLVIEFRPNYSSVWNDMKPFNGKSLLFDEWHQYRIKDETFQDKPKSHFQVLYRTSINGTWYLTRLQYESIEEFNAQVGGIDAILLDHPEKLIA